MTPDYERMDGGDTRSDRSEESEKFQEKLREGFFVRRVMTIVIPFIHRTGSCSFKTPRHQDRRPFMTQLVLGSGGVNVCE